MRNISRRLFIKTSATGMAAAAVAPGLLNSCTGTKKVTPRKVKGDKVAIAFIGIGNQGNGDIKKFIETDLCTPVALCDVDMGAEQTKEVIEMFPDIPRYTDFRVMFKEMGDKIEAVMVATPDFSHFAICMAAMKLGIHVYVEKPLANTFYENELLMAAEKKFGVVTQMGNQGHSEANYFQFKAWKDAGIIKDVTEITAHMNNSRRWHNWDPAITEYPSEPKPDTLNWDVWLGPAQEHEYHHDFHNGQWRCWYEFGMGALGDWGAHIIDTAHQFLELGLPYEVEPLYLKDHNQFFYPMSSTIRFRFPERNGMPPVDLTWYDGLDNIPPVPAGYGDLELDPNIPPVAGGKIQAAKLNPGKEIYTKTLTFKGGSHGSTLSVVPESAAEGINFPKVPDSPSNHWANFLLSVMGKEEPRSPFSISGPLSQVFCLGIIAQWTGRKIVFDREKKQIVNDPQANQLLWGSMPREGWREFFEI